ncbi:MHYT domain-containing protein [Bradyrhizobium sp.]|uniref:MHYT domain-containing protein n=1 Tax=Bradyrhizobium sp. TaxID=376 RepID=UPI003BAF8450
MTTGFATALFSDGKKGIVAGGAMLGIGIACMHYLGMAALGDHTEIVWIPGYVFASVLLSVAFSVVSLLLARRGDTPRQLAAASVFLTLAIVSLHFVSMSAIDTIRARTFIADKDLLPQHAMAWVVAAIATTVVVGGWIGAMSDRWAGRDVSGEPVVTNSCAFYFRTRGCGCIGHPAFPAPSLSFEGQVSWMTRAHSAPRDRGLMWSNVIARSDPRALAARASDGTSPPKRGARRRRSNPSFLSR